MIQPIAQSPETSFYLRVELQYSRDRQEYQTVYKNTLAGWEETATLRRFPFDRHVEGSEESAFELALLSYYARWDALVEQDAELSDDGMPAEHRDGAPTLD